MIVLTSDDDVLKLDLVQDETVDALAGNDRVTVGPQNYDDEGFQIALPYAITVTGGSGDDVIGITAPVKNGLLYGGDGDDVLYDSGDYYNDYHSGNVTAYGGAGDDVISGEYIGADGGDGNDTLYDGGRGGAGDDIIYEGGDGGDGSDIIIYGGGEGGSGDDYMYGGEVIRAGDGSDFVTGGAEVHGGAGNDIMGGAFRNGEAGRDVYFGLSDLSFVPGEDKLAQDEQFFVVSAFTGRANEVVAYADHADFDFDGDGVSDYSSYELPGLTQDDFLISTVVGDPLDTVGQTLSGTAANDFFYGGGGDDKLAGKGGIDFVFGGFGDDALAGDTGDDMLSGQAGADRLQGGSGDDELDGGNDDDTLSGGIGNDFAYGGNGDDIVGGGAGADRLLGNAGADRLNGGDGDDILTGGAGADFLIGGGGADTFVFAPGDSGIAFGSRDRISDFTSGIDTIDLTAFGAVSVSIAQSGKFDLLSIDKGGDGTVDAVVLVEVVGSAHLAMADIVF